MTQPITIPDNLLRLMKDASQKQDTAQHQASIAIEASKSFQAQIQMLLYGFAIGQGINPPDWKVSDDGTQLIPKVTPTPPLDPSTPPSESPSDTRHLPVEVL